MTRTARIAHAARQTAQRATARAQWFEKTPPGRAITRYTTQNGNVLSGGIAYYSLTSIAAGLVLGVTVASAVVGSNPAMRDALYDFIASSVPGIIKTDDSPGLVDPDALTPSATTGVLGLIALIVLINTATRYFRGLRGGIRVMLGDNAASPVTGKLRDLAALLGMLIILVVGAVLQVLGSHAASAIAAAIGDDGVSEWLLRGSAIVAGFVVDSLFVALVLLVLGRSRVKAKVLLPTIAATAFVLAIMRILSSLLVTGATQNPVLAPFAAIISLLLFVDLVARVLLIAAALIGAVSAPLSREPGEPTALPSPTRRSPRTVTTARATGRVPEG